MNSFKIKKMHKYLQVFIIILMSNCIMYAKKNNFQNSSCTQCWTCANCKKILYKNVEIRPSRDGCPDSWFGHNWAYQGCIGNNLYKCKRCGIKIMLEFKPANIKSDNCTISSDDNGRRHEFIKIN